MHFGLSICYSLVLKVKFNRALVTQYIKLAMKIGSGIHNDNVNLSTNTSDNMLSGTAPMRFGDAVHAIITIFHLWKSFLCEMRLMRGASRYHLMANAETWHSGSCIAALSSVRSSYAS